MQARPTMGFPPVGDGLSGGWLCGVKKTEPRRSCSGRPGRRWLPADPQQRQTPLGDGPSLAHGERCCLLRLLDLPSRRRRLSSPQGSLWEKSRATTQPHARAAVLKRTKVSRRERLVVPPRLYFSAQRNKTHRQTALTPLMLG